MQQRFLNSWFIALIAALLLFVSTAQARAQVKSEKLHVGYSAQAGSLAPIGLLKKQVYLKSTVWMLNCSLSPEVRRPQPR